MAINTELPPDIDLLSISMTEVADLLSSGQVTSVALVKAYLANIERNNINGLGLRAIIQVAPTDSVLVIAQSLDDERSQGNVRGPLHGIPLLVKDSIATDPDLGMSTSCGSTALQMRIAKAEAEVVKKLRKSGAIILAKANLSELAGMRGYIYGVPHGWSAVGGQASSAYVKSGYEGGGDPYGSSAGSAIGVSAGFGAAAIGSETGPASRAALFSIRSPGGLISGEGVMSISRDRDSVGPLGKSAMDVALMLDVLVDADGKFAKAAQSPQMIGLRLGVVRKSFLDSAEDVYIMLQGSLKANVDAMEAAVETMQKAGAVVMDVNMDVSKEEIIEFFTQSENVIYAAHFKEEFADFLLQLQESPVRSIEGMIKWNEEHAAVELPPNALNQQLLVDMLTASDRESEEYFTAQVYSKEIARTRGLEHIFERHNLDAAIFAMELGVPQCFVSAGGYAAGTAPMGYSENGAPLGILFVTKPEKMELLVSLLAGFEIIMPKRKVPQGL